MNTATPARATAREWLGLTALALPTLAISLSLTVLNLAVPHLSAALEPSGAQLLWVVDIYGFLIAGLLITMGAIGDRIGRRRMLLAGGAAFGAASLVAALSVNVEMLIAARALMGVAGATLMPSTMSLIRSMFHDGRQRGVAVSVWISCFIGGTALGPVMGGALLERFWWGSVFLPAVPVAVLLLLAGPFLLPEHRADEPGRLDPLSVVALPTATLTTVYGLKKLTVDGVQAVPALIFVAGLALAVTFVLRQRALRTPLLDLGLFGDRSFTVSVGALSIAVFALGGTSFFIAQYLQMVAGLSPFKAGLVVVPAAVANIAATMLAPLLARRIRPSRLMSGGLALAAAGVGFLTQVSPDSGYGIVIAGGVVMSLGLGPVLSLGSNMVISAAPAAKAGAASAVSETGTDLGAALSIAIMGGIGTAVYRSEVGRHMPAGLPADTAAAAQDTIGAAVAAARELPARLGDALVDAAGAAFTDALRTTAGISAVLVLCLAACTAVLLRNATDTPEGQNAPTNPEEAPDREAARP